MAQWFEAYSGRLAGREEMTKSLVRKNKEMEFCIADTFADSLANLTGDEQKGVKPTAFDLQLNPASLGMKFHKLNGARDPNFWSVRVSRDIRLIIYQAIAPAVALCRPWPHHPVRIQPVRASSLRRSCDSNHRSPQGQDRVAGHQGGKAAPPILLPRYGYPPTMRSSW